MLKKTILTGMTLAGMALAISNPALAASQGAKNGKPFLELTAEIAANSALIEANQSDISALQTDVSSLKLQVSSIETDITTLAGLIDSNSNDIQTAFDDIANAQDDIDDLSQSLSDLADQHQTDVHLIALAISEIHVELSYLATASALLAADLDAKISAVRDAADANSSSLDSLLLDIALINAELTSVNSNYNSLTNQVNSLQAQLGIYAAELAAFESELNNLNSRVTTLEGFHITDAVCGGNDEFCKDLPWVYIDVENGLAWAWASPCSGGCSQIDLIGRAGNLEGWRFASVDEWNLRPSKTVFGGTGFGSAPGDITCAAPIFDRRYNHCDYSNNPVRVPDGSYQEQWVVHDLFTTP